MVDRERVLGKLDELDGYLAELRAVAPATLEAYLAVDLFEKLLRRTVRDGLGDFAAFRREVLAALA